ncbi:hypothetical protein CI1B_49910 [Bradyrhizobium ivorense]|uniref:Uncharacterized protein n=1 Tax=Bradyrhizobium ivorense TaxID=2511166 RepID=A0A508TD79_9BRAD|nr:hypothetical protein CI1B_49910 [Bradyrhizobium ivorense]VIO80738.1 hypothetical protein CI41S_74870 [Bradyrhizobium ivorense]
MSSLVFRKDAADTAAKSAPVGLLRLPSGRGWLLRLRRKGPSWAGLALLLLAADLLLALAAWGAVDFFRH